MVTFILPVVKNPNRIIDSNVFCLSVLLLLPCLRQVTKLFKGVVRNRELAITDPEEIKKNVPIITDVHCIIVKMTNEEIKTNTLILTCNTKKNP